MKIDDRMINQYLHNDQSVKEHWIFTHIENGHFLFEEPDKNLHSKVQTFRKEVIRLINNFEPLNPGVFSELFPKWKEHTKDTTIILAVGCPEPYDAMAIEYQGDVYIIFDLIRLLNYVDAGYDAHELIRKLLTHEVSHICLYQTYSKEEYQDYKGKLKFITFHEGYAHLLAMSYDIRKYDFSEMITEHYQKSINKLEKALQETDPKKQETLLNEANAGAYWDKFAAISGKLFLANNRSRMTNLYDGGINNFIKEMGID